MHYLWQTLRSYDFSIYYYLYEQGVNSSLVSSIYYFFAKYGIVFFLLSFTYLIWMKKINAFLCSFLAMGLAGLFDLLIFAFWQRPRPFVTHGDLVIPAINKLDVDRVSSFPSSHTYIVFAIALSVYLYGHRRLGTLLFLLAVVVAIGRIGTGLHYPSDTIGGAILGMISGIMAYRFVHHNEHKWEYEGFI